MMMMMTTTSGTQTTIATLTYFLMPSVTSPPLSRLMLSKLSLDLPMTLLDVVVVVVEARSLILIGSSLNPSSKFGLIWKRLLYPQLSWYILNNEQFFKWAIPRIFYINFGRFNKYVQCAQPLPKAQPLPMAHPLPTEPQSLPKPLVSTAKWATTITQAIG